MRHRESWAVEARAPSRGAHARLQTDQGSRPRPAASPAFTLPAGTSRPLSVDPQVRAAAPTAAVPSQPAAPSPSGAHTPSAAAAFPMASASPGAMAVSLSPVFDKDDVLVVVSKLKKFVRDRSGMNTSDGVMELLSEHLRFVCDEAVRNAAADGRKTVLDRDVKPVTARWRNVR